MSYDQWEELTTYTAERARGVVHTRAWRKRMEARRRDFTRQQLHELTFPREPRDPYGDTP